VSFKDHIAHDIKTTFLNTGEVAEDVVISGKPYTVVVDDDRLKERQASDYNGILEGEVLYFIEASALPKMPAVGEVQIFRGRQMFVSDSKHDMGMYEVILTQNRSG
jgi:hypothetical protein